MAYEDLSPEVDRAVRALKHSRGECPSAEDLLEYGTRGAADRQRHPIDPHVQICSRCQLVLHHVQKEPAAQPMRWLLPAAAALFLAVLAPLIYRAAVPAPPPDTIRGTSLQLLSPVGPVTDAREFQWQSPIQAAQYRVTIFRDSEVVWRGTSATTRLTVPATVTFEPEVRYLWQVEALDSNGESRVTSERQAFDLTAR